MNVNADAPNDAPAEKPPGVWARFTDAWRQRHDPRFHRPRNADSLDFLPAALEILEKPPSPAGRWLGYSLIALFTLAVAWACFGQVDVVATAEGKILPGGRVKQIQPLQTGVIQQILVTEGQRVAKGEALIELDQTLTGADLARLQQQYRAHRRNALREQCLAELFRLEEQGETFSPMEVEQQIRRVLSDTSGDYPLSERAIARQVALAQRQWQEYQAKQAGLQSQLRNRQSELVAVEATIKKYQGTIPLINKRVNALAILNKDGIIAEARLLELQEHQVTQQQNLVAEQARRQQLLAAIDEVQQQKLALRSEARKANLERLDSLQQQADTALQELTKADDRHARQFLYAPVAGRVQQLAVHTIGGVVQEAQALMQIVPEEDYLEVEAILANKDIGFIQQGQRAEIKVHTFPFTKYGVIDAEVVDITADAIESEQQGLVYKVRLKMADDKLWVDQRWVDLLPGMAVSAEVKTGQRRLIEFFLSPLLRYRDESVRER